ncbi:ATP-binding cassette domain-containing protein [Streptomyces sp. SID4919]|uniref:ABC transporter ATP-binding protein n=1 Tax=unclassified Streptomyces TaxID=2593676 RepID=UPI0008239840|nr:MULTISPECIES: ABC transporter ATP-binding protein [unclassified Streptomyces]MYY10549.1 ATP-binding cassette domain-containing protein [Streptomyces sp. SID4919]SCK47333.1 ABC-type multidrug transport system, ATPase and permease component [Streptomyces sp. AmelKG-E11A]
MADQPVLGELPDQRAVFRRAAPWLRGHRVALAAAVLLNLAGAALAVGVTAAIGRVVDAADDGDREALVGRVLLLLVLVAATGVLTWASRYWLIRVGERVLAGLREHATAAVGGAPLRFVEAHRGGELLRRLTGELDGLARFVGGTLPDLVAAALVLVFTVVMLALYSWPLTLALLIGFLPPAVLIVRRFQRRAGDAYAKVAAAETAVAARFAESLPAREQLRIAGAVPRWLRRFRADNDRLRAAREREVVTELTLNLLTLLQAGCVAGLLVLSALFVGYGRLSVGVAVVFVLATRDILGRFEDLAAALGEARSAHVRLARLLDLVRATGASPAGGVSGGGVDPVGLPARGRLVLTGVGFTYGPGAPVVDGLSLTVAPGERLVVVGPTGAGKSTVGKLLAGLYPPDRGTVTYGGHELTALTARSLRSRIVLVPQEVTLVAGTLGENLAMVAGRPGPDRVAAVLDTLGLTGWVASLPGGLGTPLEADSLSTGERQLVAIARAVLADPAVLVLDEATAGVDRETAARIEDALSAAAGDRALVVIAHRAETVARGHRVLTMPEGTVGGVRR